MKKVVIIPARFASTRLPGKPLLDICGKPMLRRVWEIASQTNDIEDVYIATDDARVEKAAHGWGAKVIMTSADCLSGTDRLIEAARSISADVYINVQGDEPLLEPSAIEKLAQTFNDENVRIASLYCPIGEEEALKPQNVKVTIDHDNNALYFSRSLIPYPRNKLIDQWLCHLGVYGYRREALLAFGKLPASPLEQIEQLEQLRYLQAGYKIRMAEVAPMGGGVDTPEDLARAREIIREEKRRRALEKLRSIKLLVTDVDGILTDGALYYGPDGEHLKKFDARDGGAIIKLQKAGVPVAILSGRSSDALKRRAEDLGIANVAAGISDKGPGLIALLEKFGLAEDEIAYIGDDYPDIPAFKLAGVAITTTDASAVARECADLILDKKQGSIFAQIYEIIHADAESE